MQPWGTHTRLFQPGQDGGQEEAIRTKECLIMILNLVTTAGLGSIDAHQNIVKNVTSYIKCQPNTLREPETAWHIL